MRKTKKSWIMVIKGNPKDKKYQFDLPCALR